MLQNSALLHIPRPVSPNSSIGFRMEMPKSPSVRRSDSHQPDMMKDGMSRVYAQTMKPQKIPANAPVALPRFQYIAPMSAGASWAAAENDMSPILTRV